MTLVALSAGRDCSPELRARIDLGCSTQQLEEAVLLRTCHRTEIYASGSPQNLAESIGDLAGEELPKLRIMAGTEAAEHLFRVAAGLESLVIGEPQVLSQVRRAYRSARHLGTVGPVLSGAFDRAIFLGRAVRNRTALGCLGDSIGSISAGYLAGKLDGLSGRKGVVVGAGEAARDAAHHLAGSGASLAVVNRTWERAAALAAAVDGSAHEIGKLSSALSVSDFAVIAISGNPIAIHVEGLEIILDLSSPPAVTNLATGTLLDTLQDLPSPRGPQVRRAILEAETLIRRELTRFETRRRVA